MFLDRKTAILSEPEGRRWARLGGGWNFDHGALVAWEDELPAVVSVPEATTRTRTEQRIRIDGSRRTVELLEDGVAGK